MMFPFLNATNKDVTKLLNILNDEIMQKIPVFRFCVTGRNMEIKLFKKANYYFPHNSACLKSVPRRTYSRAHGYQRNFPQITKLIH